MASQLDPNVKDDLVTVRQFVTREGTYRLLALSEYSRPNRVGYTNNQSSPQVRVSLVSLPNPSSSSSSAGASAAAAASSSTNSASGGNNNTTADATTSRQQPTGQQQSAICTVNGPLTANGASGASLQGSHSNAISHLNHGSTTTAASSPSVSAMYGGDTRLGAGMSMHSMINGPGEQNGLANQVYGGDRICFNFGRELYVYAFRGVRKGTEMSKPIDKKFYKGTNPSCHDFNAASATPTGAPLLVGFTTGQIQLVSPQPGPRELRKLYNEERLIDKTKVTCLKWLPNSPNLFLASHASGHLYLYNDDLPCAATAPNYQPFKFGEGYTILTCKSKSTRNPLYKWTFNTDNCCINEFCFSPCGSNLAIVSQDGFLRVFHYDTMELLGIARSYFGGFLCVCWSPDGKYIVVGGEDDLVTVWSLHERRVVARGQGHRSWVSVVAFDPYTTSYSNWDGGDFSDDENQLNEYVAAREARFSADSTANGFDGFATHDNRQGNSTTGPATTRRPHLSSCRSDTSSAAALPPDKLAISYRLGSVGQDTQICLWDITEDVLRHPLSLRQRVNSVNLNDMSYMNGGVDADGVKVIRPIAVGSVAGAFSPPQHTSSPISTIVNANEAAASNSNSSSSKFSTANCTMSSHSSNANTPPDESIAGAANNTNTSSSAATTTANISAMAGANKASSGGGSVGKTNASNSLKFPNCISVAKTDQVDGVHGKNSSLTFSSSGYNSKSSTGSSKSPDSGISTFNSLTQRLSNFGFLNTSDKKAATSSLSGGGGTLDLGNATSHRSHRKTIGLLKSYNHHSNGSGDAGHSGGKHSTISSFSNSTAPLDSSGGVAGSIGNSTTSHSFGSLKLGGGKSTTSSHHSSLAAASHEVVNSYDPMKLIGTQACPRFDECSLLEPLVCKKIAHERLSALIFREDCFLTACQDGFIYTWARPGFASNLPQHLSPSQTAPPGGTVI